jgi:hypothetical protein
MRPAFSQATDRITADASERTHQPLGSKPIYWMSLPAASDAQIRTICVQRPPCRHSCHTREIGIDL